MTGAAGDPEALQREEQNVLELRLRQDTQLEREGCHLHRSYCCAEARRSFGVAGGLGRFTRSTIRSRPYPRHRAAGSKGEPIPGNIIPKSRLDPIALENPELLPGPEPAGNH